MDKENDTFITSVTNQGPCPLVDRIGASKIAIQCEGKLAKKTLSALSDNIKGFCLYQDNMIVMFSKAIKTMYCLSSSLCGDDLPVRGVTPLTSAQYSWH